MGGGGLAARVPARALEHTDPRQALRVGGGALQPGCVGGWGRVCARGGEEAGWQCMWEEYILCVWGVWGCVGVGGEGRVFVGKNDNGARWHCCARGVNTLGGNWGLAYVGKEGLVLEGIFWCCVLCAVMPSSSMRCKPPDLRSPRCWCAVCHVLVCLCVVLVCLCAVSCPGMLYAVCCMLHATASLPHPTWPALPAVHS